MNATRESLTISPTELSAELCRWVAPIFDRSSLGAVAVLLTGEIVYSNAKALELAGIRDWRNKNIRDLFRGNSAFSTVSEHIAQRIHGRSDEYETTMWNAKERRHIPITIAGSPLTASNGQIAGSLGKPGKAESDLTTEGDYWIQQDKSFAISGVGRRATASHQVRFVRSFSHERGRKTQSRAVCIPSWRCDFNPPMVPARRRTPEMDIPTHDRR
jgi:hypothetical protein